MSRVSPTTETLAQYLFHLIRNRLAELRVVPRLPIRQKVWLGAVGLSLTYVFNLARVLAIGGYVLRVFAGAQALQVPVSAWMFITTLCLALYLAASKRRQELRTSGAQARDVLRSYTVQLLDHYAVLSAVGAIVFCSLFVLTMRSALVITIPFVLFGLFRFRYVVDVLQGGESPTEIVWQDLPLAVTLVWWAIFSAYAVWLR